MQPYLDGTWDHPPAPATDPDWAMPDLTPWQSPFPPDVTNGQPLLIPPSGQDAFGNPLPSPALPVQGPVTTNRQTPPGAPPVQATPLPNWFGDAPVQVMTLPNWTSTDVDPASLAMPLANHAAFTGPGAAAVAPPSQWKAAPDTVIRKNPANNGATTLGNTPLATAPSASVGSAASAWPPGAPHLVTASIIPPPQINSSYVSPGQMANIIYGETGGQRQAPGGPSLDVLRSAMANAIMNGQDQKPRPKTASTDFPSNQSLLDPGAMNAWQSSFNAALGALMRTSAPTDGPGSAIHFNQRAKNATDPNTGATPGSRPAEPYLGSLGPYDYSNGKPWWAFFGKEAGSR